MTIKEEIITRIRSLIEKSEKVLATHKPSPPNVSGFPTIDYGVFSEWQSQSLAYLANFLGQEHIYVKKFEEQVSKGFRNQVQIGKGILHAVLEDVEGDHLRKIESLVSADIFGDFLEMAGYLINEGYKDPAASLIGAVLEDGMRRIASSNGIVVRSRDDLGSLNQRIADGKIYNRLSQKKIQVWNDIRNNADHGKFDEYNSDDVKHMLDGVQDFLERYLQ